MAAAARALPLLACALAAATAAAGLGKEKELQWFSQYGQDRYIYERFFSTFREDKETLTGTEAAGGYRGRRGVFVELGAADGRDKSNTLAFELQLGWTGLLIEPTLPLFERLRENRPGSVCVNECVAQVAGHYAFSEDGLNSGFSAYTGGTSDSNDPKDRRYCRTLPELIDEHLGRNVHIDYLSLDTEGSELDILRSFDFGRHTVDVITVEVHTWREHIRARKLAKLLEARGFRFLERLVDDEVWVRRRGATPDPGCLLPILGLARQRAAGRRGGGGISEPSPLPWGGWARARGLMQDVGEYMAQLVDNGFPPSDALNGAPPFLKQSLWVALRRFDEDPDPTLMESQCPVGLLTLALAALLLRSRKDFKPADIASITKELQKNLALHPMARIGPLLLRLGHERAQQVKATEQAGENFEARLPLGRVWHETRFVDALESGWPVFGLLDTTARFLATGGHLFTKVKFGDVPYNIPLKVPRMPCQLELPDMAAGAGPKPFVRLMAVDSQRGPRPSHTDLALDADSCGLLAMAAVRLPLDLFDTKTKMLVEEGERLLKLFVDRHGLYTAIWASASPRLTAPRRRAAARRPRRSGGPPEGRPAGAAEARGPGHAPIIDPHGGGGETLFGVLHSIQQMGFADEPEGGEE